MQGRKKHIKSGNQYNRYFAKSKQQSIEIPKADVMTTLDYMQELILNTLYQTKAISNVLKGNNIFNTAKNIWYFLYENIQYKLDEVGIEQLREPNRSWADRKEGIDCDCFSIFTSSILTNLNISHSLRITKYNGKQNYQHVYVVVTDENDNEIIIDPVLDSFNTEKKYSEKHDKKMKIRHQVLNGIGEFSPTFGFEFDSLSGLGLGAINENSLVDATRQHLENTLRIVETNPATIRDLVNPQLYAKQIRYVLQNWNNPIDRARAIEKVERMEDSSLNGLNGFLSKAWSTIKTAVTNTATTVANTVKSAGEKVGDALKKVGKTIVKYNPLTLAMRGGLLLAFKINIFQITKKLKWAYLTEAQAKERGFNMAQWYKLKDTLIKVENMFVKIGGDRENLKKVILSGKNGGLGIEPVTTTAAASGLIAQIVKWLKAIDFKGLFEKVKSDPELTTKLVNAVTTAKTMFSPKTLPKISSVARPTTSKIVPTTTSSNSSDITYNVPLKPVTITPTDDEATKKPNYWLWGGLAFGTGVAIYFATRPKPALAGVVETAEI